MIDVIRDLIFIKKKVIENTNESGFDRKTILTQIKLYFRLLCLVLIMSSDSSTFDETIPDINLLHLSHSNIFIYNFSSSASAAEFQNNTIITQYDPFQHLTERIVYKYICLTIFVIGVIGNLLSVLVFSRPSLRRRSCAIYFLALAITDIASLCASFIDTVLPSYNNVSLTMKFVFICKLNPLMVYFTTDLSNF